MQLSNFITLAESTGAATAPILVLHPNGGPLRPSPGASRPAVDRAPGWMAADTLRS